MSKRFFVIFLSVILLSACSFQSVTLTPQPVQPTPLNMQESVATATSTPLVLLPTFALPTSTPNAACSGAPAPHVMIGQQVTVMVEDFDKLKLRETPDLYQNTVVKELPQFTQLKVLEGPVCVASTDTQGHYLFWKVQVASTGEIGWVAEGDSLHYFVDAPTPQPTVTVVVKLPTALTCPGAPTTHVSVGQKITVITEDYDRLKLRSDPSMSSEYAKELPKFTQLKVLDGPACVASDELGVSYLFWKVEVLDTTGTTGWIAEGNAFYYFVQ
ncbi:MAG: SH3 domain-containing protein [Anaerolineales bacterium]